MTHSFSRSSIPPGQGPDLTDLIDRASGLMRSAPSGLFAAAPRGEGHRAVRLRLHRLRRLGTDGGELSGRGRVFDPPLLLKSFPPAVTGRGSTAESTQVALGHSSPRPRRGMRQRLLAAFGDVTGLAVWAVLGGLAGLTLAGPVGVVAGALAGVGTVVAVSWHVAALARSDLSRAASSARMLALTLPPLPGAEEGDAAHFTIDLADETGHFRLECSWDVAR